MEGCFDISACASSSGIISDDEEVISKLIVLFVEGGHAGDDFKVGGGVREGQSDDGWSCVVDVIEIDGRCGGCY